MRVAAELGQDAMRRRGLQAIPAHRWALLTLALIVTGYGPVFATAQQRPVPVELVAAPTPAPEPTPAR